MYKLTAQNLHMDNIIIKLKYKITHSSLGFPYHQLVCNTLFKNCTPLKYGYHHTIHFIITSTPPVLLANSEDNCYVQEVYHI